MKLICVMEQDSNGFSGYVHGLNGICMFAGDKDECPTVVAKESAIAHI